jgi:transcriptional regulator with XRE-family HTH domain
MGRRDQGSGEFGARLEEVRREQRLSRRRLAAACKLSPRRLRAFEKGEAAPTEPELDRLARCLDVEVVTLWRSDDGPTVAAGMAADVTVGDLRGEAASDALLCEYLMMVRELRGSQVDTDAPALRQDDLSELADALGGSPEAIEARLKDLLTTNDADARALRSLILPSLDPMASNS